jgi:hypothetical protein
VQGRVYGARGRGRHPGGGARRGGSAGSGPSSDARAGPRTGAGCRTGPRSAGTPSHSFPTAAEGRDPIRKGLVSIPRCRRGRPAAFTQANRGRRRRRALSPAQPPRR